VRPHPGFRLFATQNPSGAYGGRKPLSRAFRNRFVEIQINDIPSSEMITILEKRCGCPPSHSKILVEVMDTLRQRRSKSGMTIESYIFQKLMKLCDCIPAFDCSQHKIHAEHMVDEEVKIELSSM
jgi:midasin (ATPase involved in ribosome maturation)